MLSWHKIQRACELRGLSTDITYLKKTEQLLLLSAQEKSSLYQQALAAIHAHE